MKELVDDGINNEHLQKWDDIPTRGAVLTVGEDVIIFLGKEQGISGQPYFFVVGSAQGKYAIELDGNVQTPRFLLEGEESSENRQLSEDDLVRQITEALE